MHLGLEGHVQLAKVQGGVINRYSKLVLMSKKRQTEMSKLLRIILIIKNKGG